MEKEKNYQFRKRLDVVHKPDIFDRTKQPQTNETTSPTVACANSTRHRGVLNMLHLDGHVNGYKANMEDSYLDIGTKSTNQLAWGYKKK